MKISKYLLLSEHAKNIKEFLISITKWKYCVVYSGDIPTFWKQVISNIFNSVFLHISVYIIFDLAEQFYVYLSIFVWVSQLYRTVIWTEILPASETQCHYKYHFKSIVCLPFYQFGQPLSDILTHVSSKFSVQSTQIVKKSVVKLNDCQKAFFKNSLKRLTWNFH